MGLKSGEVAGLSITPRGAAVCGQEAVGTANLIHPAPKSSEQELNGISAAPGLVIADFCPNPKLFLGKAAAPTASAETAAPTGCTYLAGFQDVDLLLVHRVPVFLQKSLALVLHLARDKGEKKPRGRTLPTQNPTAQLQGALPTARLKNPRAGERTEPEGCFLLKKVNLNESKILCTNTDCIKSLNCSGRSCASTQASGRNAKIICPSTGCFV